MRRLLLESDRSARVIERDDAVAFRIADAISEDGGAGLARGGLLEMVRQVGAVEDVVAECQRAARRADELAPDQERLREPFGGGLLRVGNPEPDVRAVAQQPPEAVL